MHHSGKDCRRRCTTGWQISRNSKEKEQLIHKLSKCFLFFSLSHVSGNQVQVTLKSVKKPSWDGAVHLIHVETPKSPSSSCLCLNSERRTDSRHTDSRLWKLSWDLQQCSDGCLVLPSLPHSHPVVSPLSLETRDCSSSF